MSNNNSKNSNKKTNKISSNKLQSKKSSTKKTEKIKENDITEKVKELEKKKKTSNSKNSKKSSSNAKSPSKKPSSSKVETQVKKMTSVKTKSPSKKTSSSKTKSPSKTSLAKTKSPSKKTSSKTKSTKKTEIKEEKINNNKDVLEKKDLNLEVNTKEEKNKKADNLKETSLSSFKETKTNNKKFSIKEKLNNVRKKIKDFTKNITINIKKIWESLTFKFKNIFNKKTVDKKSLKKKQEKKKSKSTIMSRSALKTTDKIKTKGKINHKVKKKRKPLSQIVQTRYFVLATFIVISMLILLVQLFRLQVLNTKYYQNKVVDLTEKVIYGDSAPRGRIYDRNHKLLVNNKPLKIIYYKKPAKVTTKKEIELAYKLITMLSLDYSKVSKNALKKFWILKYGDLADNKITEDEWVLLDERKITSSNIYQYKLDRITDEDLNLFSEEDRKAAYVYYLMNKGYSYDEKVIKKYDVTDEEYAFISENLDNLPGIGTKLDWERDYLYGNTFRSLLGNVSSSESGIPSELKEKYLKEGYSLNDRVGTSYLEYQYENILKGKKNKYRVLADGTYQLIEEGSRGNDIVLTIDIDLQQAIEQILTEELIAAKSEPNTEFYNRSFVIVQDSKTGEILAMSGKQIQQVNGEYKIYDYSPGLLTSPVVIGSAVKGASHIVGYNTGALRIGEYRYDNCVKIAATPIKCSWTSLGLLNDITALAQSSNTYQFYTAINVGKGNYVYDGALKIDTSAFDTYRNTFAEFGLGVKTGIDLPVESEGFKGTDRKSGLLLDFSIGQYDTYTPIQLSQYITTIANDGKRLQPHLLKEVYNPTKDGLTSLKSRAEVKVLNNVNTQPVYMARVKEGFRAVMTYGTGTSYMNYIYNAAGKTGTGEGFVDTDGDNKIDTPTISNSFVAYAPYYDPKVTFTVISPDLSHRLYNSTYSSTVNKRITQRVSQKYFDIYG